jgi:uncharacterized protein
MESMVLISIIGLVVGVMGSMLGIGGGVLLIPILTGVLGLPIKTAIGASIISVIATSSAGGAVYVGKGLAHTRLGMTLEIATTLGALAGGITAVFLSPNLLALIFAIVLMYVFYFMGQTQKKPEYAPRAGQGVLETQYIDPASGNLIKYGVQKLNLGLGISFLAGNISGLLGIGGGVVKVPMMNMVMGMPIRAAIATSNFVIGITAATSAVVYYQHGYIDPRITIPTALGVLAGSQIGTRLGTRMASHQLKQVLRWLLLVFAVQMVVKAVTG